MDAALFSLINGHHSPALDDAMLLASAVGRAGFVWLVVAGIAAVFPARRMAAWRVVLAIAVASIVVDGVIKQVIHRARPFEVMPDARLIDQRPLSSSFPSGHATRAFAGALAVSRLIPSWRVAWWVLAAAIAVSRVYVGAHWPSDVLAGALLGAALAWFAVGGARVVTRQQPDASGHRGREGGAHV